MIEHDSGALLRDRTIAAMQMGLLEPGQIWSAHPNFPDYLIGAHGAVLSFRQRQPKLLRPGTRGNYPGLALVTASGAPRGQYLHRLVAETFYGPCPEGHECAHADDDKANADVLNLRWTTHLDNMADQARNGTRCRGERTGHAKLTAELVRDLRALHQRTGWSRAKIAKLYGISTMTAHRAIARETWSHVQ